MWWFAASLPEAFQRLSQKKGSRRSHVQTMNLGPKQEVYKRFMIFHDISWYFMIFHEVHAELRPFHGHFHTPRIHALTVHRPWLRCPPFHTTCPPASLRETWDLPQNEGSGSRATLGCLAASVVSAASSFDRCCSSVGTVSTSCGPDLGYYNAMWPASSIPWSRCPTRISGAPTADNSG